MLQPVQHVPPLIQELLDYHFPAYPSVTGVVQPITARSIGVFFFAIGWGFLLLISFTGWGRLFGKIARVQRLPASIACSVGIAVLVFLVGLLNLAHTVYPGVLFALAALGLLFYAALWNERPENYRWSHWDRWERWNRASPSVRNGIRILLIAALVIMAFRAAAMVRISEFDAIDDGPAYLVFPANMLAHHQFAPGPFSDRHVISSVGGSYALQALVLIATSSDANIGMADRVFGLILLFAALWDLGIAFGLELEQIVVLEFLAFLVPQQTANLTYIVLPIGLLLSLLWLVLETPAEETRIAWRYAFLAGAVGGATVALKSTFLPCVGAFCLLPYLALHWRRKKLAYGLPLCAGLGALLVMSAWMLALKLSAGTYLFPILGRGLDYSSYGIFHSFRIAKTPRTIFKLFVHAIGLFALGALLLWFRTTSRKTIFSLTVLVAAALGITAFNLAAGGDSIMRYDFPQFFSAILVCFAALAAVANGSATRSRSRLAMGLAIVSLLGCIFYYDLSGINPQLFRQMRWEFSRYDGALQGSLSGRRLVSPAIQSQYRAIDAALPAGTVALENVADPFLMHEGAQRVFFMDWAGAAGPRPGWPFGQNAAAVAQYLIKNSVQYVAYDRRYGRWLDASSCQVLETPQRYSAELYVLFWMSLLSHNQLRHLVRSYRSIYDDGQIVVVDLTRPRANAAPEDPVWSMDTDRNEMCSEVMTRYLAQPHLPEAR
jgi:hypothetical protein